MEGMLWASVFTMERGTWLGKSQIFHMKCVAQSMACSQKCGQKGRRRGTGLRLVGL